MDFSTVLDRYDLCVKRSLRTFTDFFDCAKWTEFYDILSRHYKDATSVAFGGFDDAERRIIGFFPFGDAERHVKGSFPFDDAIEERQSFPIERIVIRHNDKFNKTPRHQDYLGSILGLGIKRAKVGDIVVNEYAEAYVYAEIAPYICDQLDRVGRVPVSVEIAQTEERLTKTPEIEKRINVSSMRLDAVAAAAFRLSRGNVAALLAAEKVFVNWSPTKDAGKRVAVGDVITIRGHGRTKIADALGTTKKGRLNLAILSST